MHLFFIFFYLHGHTECLCVCVCAVSVVVICLVMVSNSTGSHPSHGSSAEFAESLFDCHTANPMTSSNEH